MKKDNKTVVDKNLTIDEYITSDEKILWRTIPNKKAYVLSRIIRFLPQAVFIIAFFGIMSYSLLSMVINNKNGEAARIITIVFLICFVAMFLANVIPIIKKFVKIRKMEYAFTNKRIIIKSGLTKTEFETINYSTIKAVNISLKWYDKLFKVGDIVITFSVIDTKVLEEIKDPYEASEKLQFILIDYNKNSSKKDEEKPKNILEDENYIPENNIEKNFIKKSKK